MEEPQRHGFLTVDQVADVLQLERHAVARMLKRGDLPGFKIGRLWRIPVAQLADRLGCDPSEFKPSVTSRYTSPTEAAELVA